MGYKCAFMDNEVYSSDDVNGIISRLTTAGVVLANSGNVLADLNTVTSEITSEGVEDNLDSCKLMVADGVYKISEGVCFMNDGSTIVFDAEGYIVTPISNTYCYVYLKRNAPSNTIDVIVSEAAGEGEFVPIAEINEYGKVFDRRVYSKAKVKLTTENSLKSYVFRLDIANGQTMTVDLGTSNFSKLILNKAYRIISGEKQATPMVATYHNALALSDGGSAGANLGANAGNPSSFGVTFAKNGQYLDITTTEKYIYNGWEYHFDVI